MKKYSFRSWLFMAVLAILPCSFAQGESSHAPLIHTIELTSDNQPAFLHTRMLDNAQLDNLYWQVPGLKARVRNLTPPRQLILVATPPAALQPQKPSLELVIRDFWSDSWLENLFWQSRSLPLFPAGATEYFMQSLPGPIHMAHSWLQLDNGERLSLTRPAVKWAWALQGFSLLEIPAQPSSQEDMALPFSGDRDTCRWTLSGSCGDEQGGGPGKFPPFFQGGSGDALPLLWHVRLAAGNLNSLVKNGRSVLRINLNTELVMEGTDHNGRVIFRHFLPLSGLSALREVLSEERLDTLFATGSLVITGEQASVAIEQLIVMAGGTPVTHPGGQKAKRSSPYNKKDSKHAKGVKQRSERPTPPDNGGSGRGGGQPPQATHIHRQEGSCCPACNNSLCRCPQCLLPRSALALLAESGSPASFSTPVPAGDFHFIYEYITPGYLQLGTLLGLPADFLLSLENTEEKQQETSLRAVLSFLIKERRLTMRRLLAAIESEISSHSGLADTLENTWTAAGLTMEVPINSEQLEIILPLLLTLKKRWKNLTSGLEVHYCRRENIETDSLNGGSCEAALTEMIHSIPSLTIEKLVEGLAGIDPALSENLEEWASEHFRSFTTTLSVKQTDKIINQFLWQQASNWERLGLGLGIWRSTLDQLAQKYTTRHTVQKKMELVLEAAVNAGLLTQGNLLLALGYLRQNGLRADLAQLWQIDSSLIPQPLTETEIAQALFRYEQKQLPLPPALVLALMTQNHHNVRLIKLLLNQPPLETITPVQKVLTTMLLQASTQETLTLETLAHLELPVLHNLSRPESHNSAPLQWRNVPRLVTAPEAVQIAIKTALLLGVWVNPHSFDDPISIWSHILTSLPWLQTGHLRQLFEQHPSLEGSIQYLPAGFATPEPTLPLRSISPFASEIAQLAADLALNPTQLRPLAPAPGLSPLPGTPGLLFEALYQALHNPIALKNLFAQATGPAALVAHGGATPASVTRRLPQDEPPEDYVCPLSLDLITEDPVAIPMTTNSGSTVYRYFSKKWLLDALKENEQNPLSRKPLSREFVDKLKVNERLRDEIINWKSKHPGY